MTGQASVTGGDAACEQPLQQVTKAMNAWVEVDLAALEANVAALRATIAGAELVAVVKANAYGAGVEGVVPALVAAGVERLAVVWASEGLAVRRLAPATPILVLGHTHPGLAAEAVAAELTLTIDSLALAAALSEAAVAAGRPANAHIHVDTGLHRDGIGPSDAISLATAARGLPGLVVEGLSTHMANADEADDSFSEAQAAAFAAVCEALPWVSYRHAANSATALRRPGLRFQGARVGLALHGVLPENTAGDRLQPILSVKARLARVSPVPAGDGVSYGLTWKADATSTVGLVPVGYADGWKRALAGAGEVLVHGRRAPMVGRVMMDQFVVNLLAQPDARTGDEVVLLGRQGEDDIGAWEVARRAGTIAWDVSASLTSRLPRVFHRAGVVERVV